MQCKGFMAEEGLFHMKGIFLRPFWRQHGLLEKVGERDMLSLLYPLAATLL